MKSRLSFFEKKRTKDSEGRLYNGQHLFEWLNKKTKKYSTYIAWFDHGKIHRKDQPAVIYSDGVEEWWENGKFIKAEPGFNAEKN